MYGEEILIEENLIRVCRGEKVEGYKVLQLGIDTVGRYKEIQIGDKVQRVYNFDEKDLDKFFVKDLYNRLHNYRREGDNIMLYYNVETGKYIVLAVKEGDDLSKSPFNLPTSLIITKEMLDAPKISLPEGIVPITQDFLSVFKSKGIFTEEIAYVLYFNRKNPGFYL